MVGPIYIGVKSPDTNDIHGGDGFAGWDESCGALGGTHKIVGLI